MENLEKKLFTKNDASFVCAHCGKEVKPLGYSSRNHCPFCLWSLHVDNNPGDRENTCRAPMEPIFAEVDPKKDLLLCTNARNAVKSNATARLTRRVCNRIIECY